MINPKTVQVHYWSCGCVTWNVIEHAAHTGAFIVGVERKIIDWTAPEIVIEIKTT